MLMVIGFVASLVLSLGAILYNQSAFKGDVAELKSGVAIAVNKTAEVSTDQDKKREDMGKAFLASQEQIVAKVSELTTQQAVSQVTTKQMADTLTTISNKIGDLSLAAGHPKGR